VLYAALGYSLAAPWDVKGLAVSYSIVWWLALLGFSIAMNRRLLKMVA
jgi:hypothetical protein